MRIFLLYFTLIWGFAVGVILTVIIFSENQIQTKHTKQRTSFEYKYAKWFRERHLKRSVPSMDLVQYGTRENVMSEAEYLSETVRVLCIMLVQKDKNAEAANQTWMRSCNEKMFIKLEKSTERKVPMPIRRERKESSWYLVCEALRRMPPNRFDWALFLYDDTFAIVENLRYMVAGLEASRGHYLGHAVQFWDTVFNEARCGYVLSRGSVQALRDKFNTSEACRDGGRFWNQEDYYMGRHLRSMGITPSDTRDADGLTTFHRFNIGQLLFPGSLVALSDRQKRSVYGTECCSPRSVTFHTVEADKMYTNHYLLYGLHVFREGGHLGNGAAPTPVAPHEIWHNFVREQGIAVVDNVSAEMYFDLWKNLVNDPVHFNRDIANWSRPILPISGGG